ncbi:MAG TPA: efflux RND transporter periplasmic adaptor subunit, partial [Solirubrobacterales bacterium]|nr:efflux RND transporter periplasmic adaptor subunit [Solirubrobacterales bacterium]
VVERAVNEGEGVTTGALVARLESPELEAEVTRLEASLRATETRVPQLRTEIAQREELTRRRVAEARATLAAREARLDQLRNGSRPEEVAEAEAALAVRRERLAELKAGSRPQEVQQAEAEAREAKAVMENAQTDSKRMEDLYRKELIAAQERDAARMAFAVAAERYASALERLALVREGPRPEEIRRAEAEVRQADAVLALVRQGPRPEEIRGAAAEVRQAEAALRVAEAGELDVTLKRQEVATLQANIARDRAALAGAQAQLGYTVLRTPQAGVVLRKHVEPGEMIAAGTPVVTIADLGDIWLKIYVPEPELGRIKLGQTADITTDSYPGKSYPGTVTFISSEAEFTPKNIQTQEERVKLVFAVKISVANPNQELKPGMPADATVRLD